MIDKRRRAMRNLRDVILMAMGVAISGSSFAGLPQFATATLNNVDVGRESKPAVVDIDKDGDVDIFIGTQDGRVLFYRNQGTYDRPNFILVSGKQNPFDGFDVGESAAPTFADIDGDGDFDAFIGGWDGVIKYYQNEGDATAAKFIEYGERDFINPFRSIDVGRYSIPSFVDIDGDRDLDAFIGNWGDKLDFYLNTGTRYKAVFDHVKDINNPFNDLDLGDGLAPVFADIDKDGDQDVLIGLWNGRVKFFRNIGSAYNAEFRPAAGAANPLFRVKLQRAVSPALVDIDMDGDLDAFVGEDGGTIHYYHNNGKADAPRIFGIDRMPEIFEKVDVSDKLALSLVDLDGDNDLDLVVGERYQAYRYYLNSGSEGKPIFSLSSEENNPLRGIIVAGTAPPVFVDIDMDYDLDMFLGQYDGTVVYYRNEGTRGHAEFELIGRGNPLRKFDVGNNAVPAFADMDGDGDLDVLIGGRSGKHLYLRNKGKADNPKFQLRKGDKDPFDRFEFGSKFAPLFSDPDDDGDYDLLYGTENGTVGYYRNFAEEKKQPKQPTFDLRSETYVLNDAENPYAHLGAGAESSLALSDLDGDGDVDLIIAAAEGVIQFYENTDPSPVAVDDYTLVAKDQYKVTQPVMENDRFKKGRSAENFHLSDYDSYSVENGSVELNYETNTFTYTPRVGFLGEDSFQYSLDDREGIRATARVIVHVIIDKEAPRIILNQLQLINAENVEGVSVDNVDIRALLDRVYAIDNVDGRVNAVRYEMPEHLPIGETIVEFSVSDLTGNQLIYPVTFSVADREGPQLTQPEDLVWPISTGEPIATATMGLGEFVASVTAIDNIDGVISQISHDLPEFLLPGKTIVTFSAVDATGNLSAVSASITMADQIAPVITVPTNLIVPAHDKAGNLGNDERIVEFIKSIVATDNVGITHFSHDAPSYFPVGTTTIVFTAEDAAGNETTKRAKVIVTPVDE